MQRKWGKSIVGGLSVSSLDCTRGFFEEEQGRAAYLVLKAAISDDKRWRTRERERERTGSRWGDKKWEGKLTERKKGWRGEPTATILRRSRMLDLMVLLAVF